MVVTGESIALPALAETEAEILLPRQDACVRCQSAEDADNILSCNGCGWMYHTFCLQPVLPRLPPTGQEWFCKTCVGAESIDSWTLY
jgi:hypothetical protein